MDGPALLQRDYLTRVLGGPIIARDETCHRGGNMARGLPEGFPPAERSYSLYEGVEYQGFWDDPRLRRQDMLEQHIVSEMLPASGRRILDLGAGYGRLAPCYVDRFDQVILCDGSLSLLRDARAALGNRATLVAADLGRLPFKAASFDCVLTIRVLQHVHELTDTLAGVRRILGGDGRLVFSYHNKRNAKDILRNLVARGDASPFSLQSTEPMPTLISRHPTTVEATLADVGFSPPDYQGTAFVHALAGITERFGSQTPAGARVAPFMGRHRLAPWLIGKSFAQGPDPLRQAHSIDDLLQCPACAGNLDRSIDSLSCSVCRRGYPIDDGILDFRLPGNLDG